MVNLEIGVDLELNNFNVVKFLDKRLEELAEDILDKSRENLVKVNAVDTSNLIKSGSIKRRFLEYSVEYSAPYASIVEFGREGSDKYPPIDALRSWVRRRLGIRNKKEVERVTWAIATKIKKRGIEARPYLRPAVDEMIRKRRAK